MSIALNRRPSILLAGHPDLVHLSGGPGGLQLLRRLPVPVLYTANHTFRQAHGPLQALRLYGRVEAAAYRRADRVAAISPSTADAVVAMGISPERVVVISPGIETDPMLTDERRVEGRMLFFGRLEPEKNPLQAVAVMREVARLVPGAHGRVLGSGALATAVANACAASGGAVTFAGRLSDDDVVEELRAARVVVVPSDYEGLGLVALEAMARGAAVVAYDVTGLRDAVADLGVLVGHGDVAAMVEASRSLLVDEQARADIARRAFDAVRNERSWDRCAAEYHALYLDVIG
jgi:glycosyltransferase involved in cell wall biosynthesis